MAKCSKKLHAEIANVRRQAYDVRNKTMAADFWAKDAERNARAGKCTAAGKSLKKAQAAVAKAWR